MNSRKYDSNPLNFYVIECAGVCGGRAYDFQTDEGDLPRSEEDVICAILERMTHNGPEFTKAIRVIKVSHDVPARDVTEDIVIKLEEKILETVTDSELEEFEFLPGLTDKVREKQAQLADEAHGWAMHEAAERRRIHGGAY